jgi:hypothetical protein
MSVCDRTLVAAAVQTQINRLARKNASLFFLNIEKYFAVTKITFIFVAILNF